MRISSREVLDRIAARIRVAGSQKAAAAALGISAQYLTDILNGRREPGPKMLKALGLERISSYREVR